MKEWKRNIQRFIWPLNDNIFVKNKNRIKYAHVIIDIHLRHLCWKT